MKLTEAQRKFMTRLVKFGGVATARELGPQMTQEDNSARQRCKRCGWVIYNIGCWQITEAGRALLQEEGQ